jgi:hypothetical protein
LVAVQLRTEKGADRIEDYAEARRGGAVFKPTHGTVTLFDSAVILLQVGIQIAVGPMRKLLSEDIAYNTRVGVVPICGNAFWDDSHCLPGGVEEHFDCGQVARVAQPDIHEMAVPINSLVEILLLALNTHVGLIDIPAPPHHPMAPLA